MTKWTEVREMLTRAARTMAVETAQDDLPAIIAAVDRVRRSLDPNEWRTIAEQMATHPVAAILMEDPFTRRSAERPRGYAGDAVLLDYIYRGLTEDQARSVTSLGNAIFEQTARASSSAVAVRERRDWCARWIDEAAATRPSHDAQILSVACGHMRELSRSQACIAKNLQAVVGLDQDAESIEEVRRTTDPTIISAATVGVRELLRKEWDGTGFDLIYSAGLYDYLNREVARRLTAVLFAKLRAGGRLIIANFVPDFATRAYMEAFMSWWLITRTEAELLLAGDEVPICELASCRSFTSSNGNIVYAEFVRC
jgi:hypothetical protein